VIPISCFSCSYHDYSRKGYDFVFCKLLNKDVEWARECPVPRPEPEEEFEEVQCPNCGDIFDEDWAEYDDEHGKILLCGNCGAEAGQIEDV